MLKVAVCDCRRSGHRDFATLSGVCQRVLCNCLAQHCLGKAFGLSSCSVGEFLCQRLQANDGVEVGVAFVFGIGFCTALPFVSNGESVPDFPHCAFRIESARTFRRGQSALKHAHNSVSRGRVLCMRSTVRGISTVSGFGTPVDSAEQKRPQAGIAGVFPTVSAQQCSPQASRADRVKFTVGACRDVFAQAFALTGF